MQNSINISDKKNTNLEFLPTDPGIYRFKTLNKEVIYIGKAKNLKKRVKSYFLKSSLNNSKLERLLSESSYIDLTITTSELEALLLEQRLIKKLKPKYNVQFKDDKGYSWIKISSSKQYPSAVSFLGKKKSKDKYFGPFPSSLAVKSSLKVIQKIFKLRDCNDTFFKNRKRPCLQYEIGRCSAPCIGAISKNDYIKEVNQVINLIEGKGNDLLEELYSEMDTLSQSKSYEKAADCRNKISSLREIQREQNIAGYSKDRDAIFVLQSKEKTIFGVTSVRGGWITSHKNFIQEKLPLKEGLIDSFLSSYYTNGNLCPDFILINQNLFDQKSLQATLSEYHKKKIIITNKLRNKDFGLMKISKTNTDLYFRRHQRKKRNLKKIFISLKDRFDLKGEMKLIESYDVSHFSGKSAVAGKITYNQHGPVKDKYRIYNISNKNSGNDIGSIQEVIRRRFLKKNLKSNIPSLILIDGGKTHLNSVKKVLEELNVKKVNLLSISKGFRRKKELDLIHTENGKVLSLENNSIEFNLIQEIRDETHRFSITKQRSREAKKISISSLDIIESVGRKRKKALLRYFGSFDQIKKASVKDLLRVKGVGKRTADIIFKSLH